jgi:hypothetical protein
VTIGQKVEVCIAHNHGCAWHPAIITGTIEIADRERIQLRMLDTGRPMTVNPESLRTPVELHVVSDASAA